MLQKYTKKYMGFLHFSIIFFFHVLTPLSKLRWLQSMEYNFPTVLALQLFSDKSHSFRLPDEFLSHFDKNHSFFILEFHCIHQIKWGDFMSSYYWVVPFRNTMWISIYLNKFASLYSYMGPTYFLYIFFLRILYFCIALWLECFNSVF